MYKAHWSLVFTISVCKNAFNREVSQSKVAYIYSWWQVSFVLIHVDYLSALISFSVDTQHPFYYKDVRLAVNDLDPASSVQFKCFRVQNELLANVIED